MIFIDVGGWTGGVSKKFLELNPKAKVFIIEPNPKFSYDFPCEHIKKAAWVNDGEIKLFLGHRDMGLGSTVIKGKTSGRVDYDRPLIVPCMDFSRWLLENFNKGDNVIVKMNIEGAEYEILSKMILDGSINLVKELFVSLHDDKKIAGITEKFQKMKQELTKFPNVMLMEKLKKGYPEIICTRE